MFGFNGKELIDRIVSESNSAFYTTINNYSSNLNGSSNTSENESDNSPPQSKGFSQFYLRNKGSRRSSNAEKKVSIKNSIPTTRKLSLSGENADTIILVPDLFSHKELELKIPYLNLNYQILDPWYSIKNAISDAIPVHPTSVASLHDRACEIFYELKGGRVDYGKEHSRKFCHEQYGASYPGLVPNWSKDNPIVFLGKGYGAQTILYLQYLLATDYFKCNTNAEWIKGVISVEGSFLGSTLPYVLGLLPCTKTVVHPLSILQLFLSFIHLLLWFDLGFLSFFGLDQMNTYWRLSFNQGASFCAALIGRSAFSNLEDSFIYDYSVEGANWHTKLFHLAPNCIYLNYIVDGSMRSKVTGYHLPRPSSLFSFIPGWFLGRIGFNPSAIGLALNGKPAHSFWENNGYIPVICQMPPNHHSVKFNLELRNKILDPILYPNQTGIWHNIFVRHKNSMRLFQSQQTFYEPSKGSQFISRFSNNLDILFLSIVEALEHLAIKIYSYLAHPLLSPLFPFFYVFLWIIGLSNFFTESTFDKFKGNYYEQTENDISKPLRKSDNSAQLWARDIETRAFLQSPSSVIRWMNQSSDPTDPAGDQQLNLDAQAIRRVLEAKE